MDINLILLDYFQTYVKWIDADAPEGKPFQRGMSLCENLRAALMKALPNDTDTLTACSLKLEEMLPLSPFRDKFPFNDGGVRAWIAEGYEQTCHLNPKRTAWVRKQLEKPQ